MVTMDVPSELRVAIFVRSALWYSQKHCGIHNSSGEKKCIADTGMAGLLVPVLVELATGCNLTQPVPVRAMAWNINVLSQTARGSLLQKH